MIVSFYDKNFKGLQDNASLVIDDKSYSLIKRGVDFDSLSCKCEPFTENIQPTFLIVKNDRGNYVYGCLAGIPQLNGENQTEIVGTDLKTMLKSDVVVDLRDIYESVCGLFETVFLAWKTQVNQETLNVEFIYGDGVSEIMLGNLNPKDKGVQVYNAWDDLIAPYLKYYGLYMTSSIDLINKKVTFTVKKSMVKPKKVKLWELGIKHYGKWVASVNETQCCVYDTEKKSYAWGYKWILRSDNVITDNEELRDIYPVKRKVIWKEKGASDDEATVMNAGNSEALEELTKGMFNENLELSGVEANFETRFDIYVQRGGEMYKSLPCGELHYDANGLTKVQVGYRFTGIQFLL